MLLRYYLYIYGAEDVCALDEIVAKEVANGDFSLAELLAPGNMRGYLAKCMDDGLQARTVNLHLSALSGYCRWLLLRGELLPDGRAFLLQNGGIRCIRVLRPYVLHILPRP